MTHQSNERLVTEAALETRIAALPPGGGGTATTDASLLTTGILPAARIGNASIVDAKLASGTALTPAERTKLAGAAPLASPAFTGAPTINGSPIGSGTAGGDGVVFEGRRNVITAFGVTGNGTTDDILKIQTAIDSGAPLVFPAGNYRCTNSLRVDAGTDLYLAPGSRLIKDFANAGGNNGSFVTNRVLATKVNDLKIHGFGAFGTAASTATGSMFGLNGDRILLQDFTVDSWNGGRVIVLAGDFCRAINIKCYGAVAATNNGGIRYVGGRQFIALGCHVESGDDAFQFVPSPPGGDAISGLGIYDSAYIGCTGRSTNAKFMVIALQQQIPDGVVVAGWTEGVQNAGFIGCQGFGGVAALVVQNSASSGPIKDCYVSDCSVDMALGTNTVSDLDINAWASTGGIFGLTIRGLTITNAQQSNVTISRQAEDTTIQDCNFNRGSAAQTTAVVRLGGRNTKLLNSRIDAGGLTKSPVTIESPLAGGGPDASRVLVQGNHIVGLGPGLNSFGVDAFVGDHVVVRDNFFEQAAGVTDARGFRFAAGVTNAKAIDNDVDSLTSVSKFSDLSTGAVIGNTVVA